MKISIKNTLAFLTFVGTLAIALPAIGQTVATTDACPDFGYAKIGADNNNTDQVHNLQTFLKDSEHLDVDVNGTFDVKTEQAVEAFQRKYMSEVMGPWEATRPSGVVNLTTVKKIKQLLCGEPLTLNGNELMAIADYQSKTGDQSSYAVVNNAVNSQDLILSPAVGADQVEDSQAAAVGTSGGASLLHRFFSFVKNIFTR